MQLLFTKIIEERSIPMINLTSIVIPLIKPDKNPSKADSYRPVSLTELFMRVMEKTMKKPLVEHVEEFNLFGYNQHGFRGNRSTTSNILIHHERILKQLEEGRSVDTNYIDLSKAFDKVGHAKLIRKLKKAGYHGRLLHFFYNFLRNRTQRVLANGELS